MLLTPYTLRQTSLQNRVVMAPMTRNRAINNIPNNLIADYYRQRASAGLIITEGVSPSQNGMGYARVPGIFNRQQFQAWRQVTDAVHARGAKIFIQLMHTGRVSHSNNLPIGSRIIAPSGIAMSGMIWTDKGGMQPYETPDEMDIDDIFEIKADFVQAARYAIEAGFDGVELHAADGYLLEQFISPHTNQREDHYGGSILNRIRLITEMAEEVSNAIGADRVGLKISPYGTANDMKHYAEIDQTYLTLITALENLELAYLHIEDETGNLADHLTKKIRLIFSNTVILSGGYTQSTANHAISEGNADLIAFGKPFISNPDLVERFHKRFPLNFLLDASKFNSAGARGFTDYPVFDEEFVSA